MLTDAFRAVDEAIGELWACLDAQVEGATEDAELEVLYKVQTWVDSVQEGLATMSSLFSTLNPQ